MKNEQVSLTWAIEKGRMDATGVFSIAFFLSSFLLMLLVESELFGSTGSSFQNLPGILFLVVALYLWIDIARFYLFKLKVGSILSNAVFNESLLSVEGIFSRTWQQNKHIVFEIAVSSGNGQINTPIFTFQQGKHGKEILTIKGVWINKNPALAAMTKSEELEYYMPFFIDSGMEALDPWILDVYNWWSEKAVPKIN